jgi:hypothetical protein
MADLDVHIIDDEGALLRYFELDPSVECQLKLRDVVYSPRVARRHCHLVSSCRIRYTTRSDEFEDN